MWQASQSFCVRQAEVAPSALSDFTRELILFKDNVESKDEKSGGKQLWRWQDTKNRERFLSGAKALKESGEKK